MAKQVQQKRIYFFMPAAACGKERVKTNEASTAAVGIRAASAERRVAGASRSSDNGHTPWFPQLVPPARSRESALFAAGWRNKQHMSRPRDRRVRAGSGGGPSGRRGGGLHGGTGDSAAPTVGVAGGRDARPNGQQQRLGHLRYSPGEERAVRMSVEKGLRLKRLEQVRQQSRQHAAAVREEYRQRRSENKRAALRESKVRVCVCGKFKNTRQP